VFIFCAFAFVLQYFFGVLRIIAAPQDSSALDLSGAQTSSNFTKVENYFIRTCF